MENGKSEHLEASKLPLKRSVRREIGQSNSESIAIWGEPGSTLVLGLVLGCDVRHSAHDAASLHLLFRPILLRQLDITSPV